LDGTIVGFSAQIFPPFQGRTAEEWGAGPAGEDAEVEAVAGPRADGTAPGARGANRVERRRFGGCKLMLLLLLVVHWLLLILDDALKSGLFSDLEKNLISKLLIQWWMERKSKMPT
jgi:hypothetical protein